MKNKQNKKKNHLKQQGKSSTVMGWKNTIKKKIYKVCVCIQFTVP